MAETKRLRYFDVMKGIAIFMVVMGHVLTMCIRNVDSSILFKLIGQIHMPLFFFISGYFSYKIASDGQPFALPNLWTRFKQLIIPFFVVSAIWIYYFPHSGLQSPIDSTWRGLYLSITKSGYWFTPCLFEIILIYAGGAYILRKCKSIISECISVFILWIILGCVTFVLSDHPVCDILGLEPTYSFFPAFMYGVLARKHNDLFERLIKSNTAYTISLLVCVIIMYILMYSWEFHFMAFKLIAWSMPGLLHIFMVIVAIRLIKPYSEKVLDENRRVSFSSSIACGWEYMGKESLSIYLLHYFFLFPLTALQEPLRGMALDFIPTFVVSFATAAVVITITLGANYIIQKSPILGLLLTGKIIKR